MTIGMTLDKRYKLVKVLGKGGTSIVYLAKDIQLKNRYWAVKCLTLNQNNDFENAIEKETELLSGLDYPDIPRIVQHIKTETHLYVIMDYINGISLDEKIQKEGIQKEENVILWSKILCDILSYLHTTKEYPIIYCDLKPKNIMLVNNRPKLIDFGIAKMCNPLNPIKGQSIGTIGYAPPEQYRNGSNILTPQSDIYSLGATMYKLLTGQALKEVNKPYTKISRLNPNVSDGMERVIYKCLRSNPSERYEKASELKNDLEQLRTIYHEPREKVFKQLMLVGATLCLTFAFSAVSVFGYTSISDQKTEYYQQHFASAIQNEQSGNYEVAEDEYLLAIQNEPTNNDVYPRLYKMMKSNTNDANYVQKSKDLIDYYKSNFEVKNIAKQPELGVNLLRDIIYLNDTTYRDYATALIEALKGEKIGKDGSISEVEIKALELVINDGNNEEPNVTAMEKDINNLKKELTNSGLTPDQQINSYYSVLLFYNAYSDQIENVKDKIKEVGNISDSIIESQKGNDNFTFDKTIQLYQIMALCNQNIAISSNDDAVKMECLTEAKYWFEKLEALNVFETETFLVKKGTTYEMLASSYHNSGDTNSETTALQKAKQNYIKAVNINSGNINTYIYIIQTCITEQSLNGVAHNYAEASLYYQTLKSFSQDNLTTTQISLIGTLKTQMQTLGIEI